MDKNKSVNVSKETYEKLEKISFANRIRTLKDTITFVTNEYNKLTDWKRKELKKQINNHEKKNKPIKNN